MALTSETCFVSIFFLPTSWILLKQLFHEVEVNSGGYSPNNEVASKIAGVPGEKP